MSPFHTANDHFGGSRHDVAKHHGYRPNPGLDRAGQLDQLPAPALALNMPADSVWRPAVYPAMKPRAAVSVVLPGKSLNKTAVSSLLSPRVPTPKGN